MKYPDIDIIDNTAIHNFEFFVQGKRSFIDYKQKDGKVYLIHTEVPRELEGKGVAEEMVEKVFHYLEAKELKIVPLCTYIRYFLGRHPEWSYIVADR